MVPLVIYAVLLVVFDCVLELLRNLLGFCRREKDHRGRQDFWDAADIGADTEESTAYSLQDGNAEGLSE